jgi:hypothetical protein
MKIARIYKTELNVMWLKNYPEALQDFLDYNIIQQKQLCAEIERGAAEGCVHGTLRADDDRLQPRPAAICFMARQNPATE